MRLSIVQRSLSWEQAEANRKNFSEILQPLKGQTDLVLLPEMFTTGFSMNTSAQAEPMDGPTMHWMQDTARNLDAAICGSFICKDAGQCYNRLVFMRPDGSFEHYDKRHLFSLANENQYFTPGEQRLCLEWKGWRICPLICYDLRFPVWSRNQGTSYDLLLYVANWPSRRAHHWRTLLPARAIENQCYVAAVNIAGTDGNGLEYRGDSSVFDFSGNTMTQIPDGIEAINTVELSLSDLNAFRQQLPFLADADHFQITKK